MNYLERITLKIGGPLITDTLHLEDVGFVGPSFFFEGI